MAPILLAQRDGDLRKLLRMVLRLDYSLEEVTDSEAALRRLRESAEPLVVILDDWPRARSEDILRTIEHEPELQRHVYLLVSAHHDAIAPDFRSLLERLSVRVIRVPFDLSELRQVVREAHARMNAARRAGRDG